MPVQDEALQSAVDSYLAAAAGGADNAQALDIALARLRVSAPLSREWELRTALVKHMNAHRFRARAREDDPT